MASRRQQPRAGRSCPYKAFLQKQDRLSARSARCRCCFPRVRGRRRQAAHAQRHAPPPPPPRRQKAHSPAPASRAHRPSQGRASPRSSEASSDFSCGYAHPARRIYAGAPGRRHSGVCRLQAKSNGCRSRPGRRRRSPGHSPQILPRRYSDPAHLPACRPPAERPRSPPARCRRGRKPPPAPAFPVGPGAALRPPRRLVAAQAPFPRAATGAHRANRRSAPAPPHPPQAAPRGPQKPRCNPYPAAPTARTSSAPAGPSMGQTIQGQYPPQAPARSPCIPPAKQSAPAAG